MAKADDTHLVIEAAIRGLCTLLPDEGYAGWAIRESRTRCTTTNIVRVERDGKPFMAFDRMGTDFHFWFGRENLHLIKSFGPEQRVRSASENPGYHSNIDAFFASPDYLWQVALQTADNAFALLEDLRE